MHDQDYPYDNWPEFKQPDPDLLGCAGVIMGCIAGIIIALIAHFFS